MLPKMTQSGILFYVIGFFGQSIHRRQPTLLRASPLLRLLCLRPFDRNLELAATTFQFLGLHFIITSSLHEIKLLSFAWARALYLLGFALLFITIVVDVVQGGGRKPGPKR